MIFRFKDKFLLAGIVYVLVILAALLAISVRWLPPGYALVGHDSGLPLASKQFLLTRLYAWDDRLGFGLDNSANFGSLTIHFFDWLASAIAGVPYAGNYVSVFFWLGLIFLSGFIFAYQLKDVFGKPFVFILPVLLTFNFYIFQSVFMLERAKFGIFSATLISLAVFLRMQEGKISLIAAALISSLAFSIFNGGGWFGVTLYGGVVLILVVLLFVGFARGLVTRSFDEFKRTLFFIILSLVFYLLLNAYSILPYLQNFFTTDAPRLLKESLSEGNKDWLRYVSRSTSFLNLFRLMGVPDWYGEPDELDKANLSHPYASIYLNNPISIVVSFLFPLLAFASFFLAKTRKKIRMLCVFGLIALVEIVFAAGSRSPFGFFYEFLMGYVPGFSILRSAFYKFGVFYMFGVLVLFAFTLSFLIEKMTELANSKLSSVSPWIGYILVLLGTGSVLAFWVGYHRVLLDPTNVFAWKTDQTTKTDVPSYIFDFADWTQENNLNDMRILLLPPTNRDWENDAYEWGYWSLSPLPYALSSARILSNWHGLNSEERGLVEDLYNAIKTSDKESFYELSNRLNVGYILLRQDVLVDSKWSSSEGPEVYRTVLESFGGLGKMATFGEWELYQVESAQPAEVYGVASINLAPDHTVPLVNNLLRTGHTAGFSARETQGSINRVSLNKVDVYDCLSCLVERQRRLKSLPSVTILPNSLFFYFKAKQEQEVLSVPKDSRSKIGDYLGLILRRTAEFTKMVDLSVKEEYLLENMEVMRLYLAKLHSELEASPENSTDFELLAQVLDFLNPAEQKLNDYLKGGLSRERSHRFGDEMLGILWDINRVKELFTPLLANSDRWSKEKVYKVNFPEEGRYTLFFSTQAFPKTIDGDTIIPETVKFIKNGEEQTLKVSNHSREWLSLSPGYQDRGDAKLILYFRELPNLFSIEESGLEKFFFGNAACYRGRIKSFDKKRAYEVLVSRTDKLQFVQVIFRDDNKVYSERHGFLRGEDLFEVPAMAKGEFSRYIYFPSTSARDISLYICSDNVTFPSIDEVIVREFFSPSLLPVKENDIEFQTQPEVRYTRVSPVRYEGEFRDYRLPFVLIFNQKMNRSWELFIKSDEDDWQVADKHFMIDGYANAWLIDQSNARKFRIEYVPQQIFYVGSIISGGALLGTIFWLVFSVLRKKWSGEL